LFEALIAQDPDTASFELRDALTDTEGVKVHHSSDTNLLFRLGFTQKNVAGCGQALSCQDKTAAVWLVQTSRTGHRNAS
jgi:hypothetical protein